MAKSPSATPPRPELTLSEKLGLFMRNNEKILWVALLVLISFSFAFTGVTTDILSQAGQTQPLYEAFGETIYTKDFQDVDRELQAIDQLRQFALSAHFQAGLTAEITDRFQRNRQHTSKPIEGGSPRVFSTLDYFLYLQEADRLDIHVSDQEIADEIRYLYRGVQASLDSMESATFKATGRPDQAAMAAQLRLYAEKKVFSLEQWKEFLKTRLGTHPRAVERSLRNRLRVEKVMAYVAETPTVDEDAILEKFREEEQSRKISFVEYKPSDELRAEVESSVTEEALARHYEENIENFRLRENLPPKLRFDYLFIPFEHFRETAQPTEEQIVAQYEKVRDEKYKKALDVEDEGFDLLTPEEQKEREAKMYRPLDEVREEVIELVREEIAEKDAEAYALSVKTDLYQTPSGGTAEPAATRSFADQAKANPFLEAGTTPFFYSYEVKDKVGVANSAQVTTWLATLRQNRNVTDPAKLGKIEATSAYFRAHGGKGLVMYKNVETLSPGEETFEALRDEVRESYVTTQLLERAGQELEERLAKAGEEGTTLEALAAEWGSEVHSTEPKKKFESIMLPAEPVEGTEADPEKEPPTRYFPASRAVLTEAFEIEKDGDLGQPVPFDREGVLYVVRLDGREFPDLADLTEAARNRYEGQLLAEARDIYFTGWYGELRRRAELKAYEGAPEV